MVEIKNNINVQKGDKVIANKHFDMFGNTVAQMGEVFNVKSVSNDSVFMMNDYTSLVVDYGTFEKYFEKIVKESNNLPKEKTYKEKLTEAKNDNVQKPGPAKADNDNTWPTKISRKMIDNILDNSEIISDSVFDNCTIVACQLPNGYTIVEYSPCMSPDNYDYDKGFDICMKKIREKVAELEAYRILTDKYEDECFAGCYEDEAYFEDEFPDCFDSTRCFNCDCTDDCACLDCFRESIR